MKENFRATQRTLTKQNKINRTPLREITDNLRFSQDQQPENHQTSFLPKNQLCFNPFIRQAHCDSMKGQSFHNNSITKTPTERCQQYDSQIAQINQRIRIAEEHKRSLHISFRPFTYISRQSHSPQESLQSIDFEGKIQKIKQNSSAQFHKGERYSSVFDSIEMPEESARMRLIGRLCKQIQLDEMFRNCKIWFQISRKQTKWADLHQSLLRHQIQMNSEEVNNIFKSSLAQHNPFFTLEEHCGCTTNALVDSYEECVRHWKQQIEHKFNKFNRLDMRELLDTLDQGGKGYITNEDLVRFLNMSSRNFFRPRDTVLLFRRISPTLHCTFASFINTFCS